MTEKELRKKAMALPLQPGVYIMKNKDRKIIYIGKAKKLKNRVSSYFGSHSNHSLKVIRMVENVDDFDYILCDSEFEALVLECSLILRRVLEEGVTAARFHVDNVELMADIIHYSVKGLEVPYIYDRLGEGLTEADTYPIVMGIVRRVLGMPQQSAAARPFQAIIPITSIT